MNAASARMTGAATGRPAVLLGALSTALFVAVTAAGPSATSPDLGPRTGPWPPWDLMARPGGALVVVVLVVANLLGAAAVLLGLRAVRAGWRPDRRAVTVAGVAVVGVLAVLPPTGSADHLSYAAYGRIAAQGADPYLVAPDDWRGGTDPVAGAALPPWEDTTSVYGPVATGVQAALSAVAGPDLRRTVWLWQLVVAACFLLTAGVLDRVARAGVDPDALRARVAVAWTLNPPLVMALVGGAHLDVLSTAAVTVGLAVLTGPGDGSGRRLAVLRAAAAGVAFAVAAGTKPTYALAGVAALWAVRRRPRPQLLAALAAGAAGAAAVLLPAYAAAGPHVADQLRTASRFTSLASPWRPVVDAVSVLGVDLRGALLPLTAALSAVLLVALVRRTRAAVPSTPTAGGESQEAFRAMLLLGLAYLVAAPYVLPWYDAFIWGPLAVTGGLGLDTLVLVRFVTLAVCYVPGVADAGGTAGRVMLGVRRVLGPVVLAGVLGRLLHTGRRARRR